MSKIWYTREADPRAFGEDWVLVKLADTSTGEVFDLPSIAEKRGDGWYKDDFENTKISDGTTGTEVVLWTTILD